MGPGWGRKSSFPQFSCLTLQTLSVVDLARVRFQSSGLTYTAPQPRGLPQSQSERACLYFGDSAGRDLSLPIATKGVGHCGNVLVPPGTRTRSGWSSRACENRASTPPGAQGVYSCRSRKPKGFFWFISKHPGAGDQILAPERIQEIHMCF